MKHVTAGWTVAVLCDEHLVRNIWFMVLDLEVWVIKRLSHVGEQLTAEMFSRNCKVQLPLKLFFRTIRSISQTHVLFMLYLSFLYFLLLKLQNRQSDFSHFIILLDLKNTRPDH